MKESLSMEINEIDATYLILINQLDLLVKTGQLSESVNRDNVFPMFKSFVNKFEIV
jgi:hypothetical protein